MDNRAASNSLKGIAIIGMAGRFPGAKSIDAFWQNLCNGVESISFFTDEELVASGVDPALLHDPNYVKAGAVLEDIERFDARFFGFSAREAEVMDPQHRLFLECAWEALENAGYDPEADKGLTGVYAGSNLSSYLLNNLISNHELVNSLPGELIAISNDKDYIPTRVSYKLNLKGPSFNVSTGCSTSLVAVHLACRGLLSYECDLALAGGIAIQVPQKAGYFYQQGGMAPPDGHCHAFDAKAQGSLFGNGVGIVVLKRLEDALADGDCINAVIKGSAISNDGSLKVSYTAPSVDGQAEAIAQSQAIAGFNPETITYIETHGTGTALGDPIEIRALEKVFRASTQKKGFCGIGSVKTNVGHLNSASGVTNLIKTVLALKHKMIPPTLHFEEPNPDIDLANSPFYVNTKLSEWTANGTPRRAGVSSFGLGGTNAHVVLEEAPMVEPSGKSRPWQLLALSAKTSSALEKATVNLAEHLRQYPNLNLADVAYTLQVGRHCFDHRRTVVCQDIEDAVSALQDPKRVLTSFQDASERPVAFMFTGLGTQYVNMAWELYQVEPTFQEIVARCCEHLKPFLGLDLRDVLYPNQNQTAQSAQQPNPTKSASVSGFDLRKMLGRGEQQADEATQKLNQTCLTQPAIFVIEYALAQLWMSWGIQPVAMIGYSIGEYVAATLAGVLSLEDAITLIAKRAQMIQALPGGAMLAVPLSEEKVRPFLNENLSLSAINGSSMSVVAGTTDAVDELADHLTQKGLTCRRLQSSHAFHSQMMEPIAESFTELVKTVSLQPPKIPYLSNVTGTWITADQATDPSYWTKHLCQPVRFADGVNQLWQQHKPILLEVGPGQTLSSLALQRLESEQSADKIVLPSLRDSYNQQSDLAFLLNTLGQLWLSGVQIDWSGFYANEHRHRTPLPTYPFERQRYWIEPPQQPSQEKFQPLPAAPELWKSLVEAGQSQAIEGISGLDDQTYQERRLWVDRLCTAYINQALKNLGAFSNPLEKYSLEELLKECQIIPRYRQLLHVWLEILVEEGHLQQEKGLFTNLLPLSIDSINTLLKEVRVRWADTPIYAEHIQIHGENLAAILTGEKETLELGYSKFILGEYSPSQQIMPSVTYYKAIMRTIMEQLVRSLSPDVNLRILEIGGGLGLATQELLPVLPSKQTDYIFTDVGNLFLKIAEKEFSAYPFVQYRLLDIEQPPQEQGYSTHSFDVVIAYNVLHVVQNMGETLDRVRSLLAPGGFLLLWEFTQASLEAYYIGGATMMNPIEDAEGSRNMSNPFLSKEQWQEALISHGFVEVAAFSEFEAFREHVFVAQASSSETLPAPAAFTVLVHQDADKTHQISLGKKRDISDWFYIPSWKRSMLPPFKSGLEASQSECWLVFVDECGLGTQLVKRLEREGQNVITVRVGEQFGSESESPTNGLTQRTYTIEPRRRDDYDALFKDLRALDVTPKTILHLWSVTPHNQTQSELEGDKKAQDLGFYSLLFLAQALGEQNLTDSLEVGIVSNNMQDLTGEQKLCPEKALILGPCKIIPIEYPNIKCRSIDIVIPKTESWQEKELVNQLLAEFTTQTSDDLIVAYRGVHRWVQALEPVRLDGGVEGNHRLREEGVYLIVGGLGGVGLTLAEYLARTVKAKLILIGRSAFPNRDEWSGWLSTHDERDDISLKIRKVQALEALGAQVLVLSADVANVQQMSAALAQANHQFGQIHGVIHAAVVPGGGMIQLKTPEAAAAALAPKVRGTRVLDILFKDANLDFFVLCSSLRMFQPTAGIVDYIAANAFLEAFAHYNVSKHGTFTRVIDWDLWSGLGTAVSVEARYIATTGEDLTEGMTPEEGIEAFRRILLNSTVPQIVVSTRDLLTLDEVEQKLSIGALEKANVSKLRHQRPELKNAYVAPSNELERKIAESFQKFLGFEQLGIHDNFFGLGGDSLTGSVLINQIRHDFQVELPVRSLFEAPTVAELALVIEEIIIEEIEELTEEEANLTLEKDESLKRCSSIGILFDF